MGEETKGLFTVCTKVGFPLMISYNDKELTELEVAPPPKTTVKVVPVNCTVSPLVLATFHCSTGTLLAPPTTWLAGTEPPTDTCTTGWVAVAVEVEVLVEVAVATGVLVEVGVGVGVKLRVGLLVLVKVEVGDRVPV